MEALSGLAGGLHQSAGVARPLSSCNLRAVLPKEYCPLKLAPLVSVYNLSTPFVPKDFKGWASGKHI